MAVKTAEQYGRKSADEIRADEQKFGFMLRMVVYASLIPLLYFGRNVLPFPYPHLFYYSLVALAVQGGLFFFSFYPGWRPRLYMMEPYTDALSYPLGFVFTGGFMSPVLPLAMLTVWGTPILFTARQSTGRNVALIVGGSYFAISIAQKLGWYEDPVAFSKAHIEDNGMFVVVLFFALTAMLLGYIFVDQAHKNLRVLIDSQTRMLKEIFRGTSAQVGTGFYPSLVRSLAQGLDLPTAFVGRRLDSGDVEIMAVFHQGKIGRKFRLESLSDLEDPEASAELKRLCGEGKIVSRILRGKNEEPLGVLAVVQKGKPANPSEVVELLEIFSARAAAEMERRREEEARSQLQDALSHSQRMEAIGRLAGGVAHDFNNILLAITGNASLIRMKHPIKNPDMSQKLDGILEASDRARDLTSQLLRFARKQAYTMKDEDLHKGIEAASRLLKAAVTDRITINTELKAKDHKVNADLTQLEGAILNIGLNAKDAMGKGGTFTIQTENLEMEQTSGRLRPGRYVVVSMTDTGDGMDRQTMSRLFQPYFTTKELGQGTGLGLAGVYGCVHAHGGDIWVDSQKGSGTRFRMVLPCLGAVPAMAQEAAAAGTLKVGTGNLLLVDDDPGVLDVTKELLQAQGHNVMPFLDPHEAVRHYQDHQDAIDLSILDLRMPDMDGAECFSAIKRLNPKAKIILLTGFGEDPRVQELWQHGLTDVIQKPLTRQAMDEVLGRHLA